MLFSTNEFLYKNEKKPFYPNRCFFGRINGPADIQTPVPLIDLSEKGLDFICSYGVDLINPETRLKRRFVFVKKIIPTNEHVLWKKKFHFQTLEEYEGPVINLIILVMKDEEDI